jgi:HEAT repeats
MGWLKKLFGREQTTEKVASASHDRPRAAIEIRNAYGNYDSSPLLVEESPDLEKILCSPEPPVIQKPSDANREHWSTASASERRMTAFIGYLQHPNPEVRKAAMALVPEYDPARVDQVLVDRLGSDPDPSVRIAAARTIWECERRVNCEYAVSKLRDEIDYGTERSVVGPSRAREALQLLVDNSPDPKGKAALQELVNQ